MAGTADEAVEKCADDTESTGRGPKDRAMDDARRNVEHPKDDLDDT